MPRYPIAAGKDYYGNYGFGFSGMAKGFSGKGKIRTPSHLNSPKRMANGKRIGPSPLPVVDPVQPEVSVPAAREEKGIGLLDSLKSWFGWRKNDQKETATTES